jgi:hypothetical protein
MRFLAASAFGDIKSTSDLVVLRTPEILAGVLVFTDTAAGTGVPYFYRVRAYGNGMESSDSPEATATALDDLAPDPVTGVKAFPGNGQVALIWVNPGSSPGGYEGTIILRKTGSFPTSPLTGQLYSQTLPMPEVLQIQGLRMGLHIIMRHLPTTMRSLRTIQNCLWIPRVFGCRNLEHQSYVGNRASFHTYVFDKLAMLVSEPS